MGTKLRFVAVLTVAFIARAAFGSEAQVQRDAASPAPFGSAQDRLAKYEKKIVNSPRNPLIGGNWRSIQYQRQL